MDAQLNFAAEQSSNEDRDESVVFEIHDPKQHVTASPFALRTPRSQSKRRLDSPAQRLLEAECLELRERCSSQKDQIQQLTAQFLKYQRDFDSMAERYDAQTAQLEELQGRRFRDPSGMPSIHAIPILPPLISLVRS